MPDGRGEEEFRQSRGEAVLLLDVGFLFLFFWEGACGGGVGGRVLHGFTWS